MTTCNYSISPFPYSIELNLSYSRAVATSTREHRERVIMKVAQSPPLSGLVAWHGGGEEGTVCARGSMCACAQLHFCEQ